MTPPRRRFLHPIALTSLLAAAVLTANVLFEFDRSGRSDIRAYSLQSLDRELARLREEEE